MINKTLAVGAAFVMLFPYCLTPEAFRVRQMAFTTAAQADIDDQQAVELPHVHKESTGTDFLLDTTMWIVTGAQTTDVVYGADAYVVVPDRTKQNFPRW